MGEDDDYAFGIDRLIDQGVYVAAYPLHDVSVIPETISYLLKKIVFLLLNLFILTFDKKRVKLQFGVVSDIYSIPNGPVYQNGIDINRWTMLKSTLVLKLDCILPGWDFTRTCCCWPRLLDLPASCMLFSH